MAIEIKRTPVLQGEAARAFITSVENNKKQVSSERVRFAITESKKILSNFRVKSR